jgi:DNA primase
MIEEIIKDIRDQINIIDFIGRDISLSSKDGNVFYGKCPKCGKIITAFKDQQIYICYNCGYGGDIFSYLTENHTFIEAIDILLKETKLDYTIDDIKESIEKDDTSLLEILNKEAAMFFYIALRSNIGKEGMKYYLNERKLTKETMKKFGLGFAPYGKELLHKELIKKGYTDEQLKESSLVKVFDDGNVQDKFRNRVMVPITDENGKIVAFGGRILREKTKKDTAPKYLNSSETKLFDKAVHYLP